MPDFGFFAVVAKHVFQALPTQARRSYSEPLVDWKGQFCSFERSLTIFASTTFYVDLIQVEDSSARLSEPWCAT